MYGSEYSVLIIDDDVWIQRILSKTLSAFGFSPVHIASNGFTGIAKALEVKPSLIICDILMPELSGHQVLRLLKTIKSTKDIPVIVVSAMSDAANIGFAVKCGIAGFISKPFSSATIRDKLLNVYGKEQLEIIKLGARDRSPIEAEIKEEDNFLPKFNFDVENIDENALLEEIEQTNQAKLGNKIRRHYNEDEKKSIESIKKLLAK